MSPFFFSLNSLAPLEKQEGGAVWQVTAQEASGLAGISFMSLQLSPNYFLAPQWHANAHQLGYCKEGRGILTMRTPSGIECFQFEKGDIFYVPRGFVHAIENAGNEECHIYFALNHEQPETMHLSLAVKSISENVFNATFGTPAQFVDQLQNPSAHFIRPLTEGSERAALQNAYKFSIDTSTKPVLTQGGYVQAGTKANLPILEGLSLLGFGLNQPGIVEPHWHTNAGELVFIVKGSTKITLLRPDGHLDVMEVKAGEGAFAPPSYFHSIENSGDEKVEVIAFFNHAEPDFIGTGETIGAYSNEMLASIFTVDPNLFNKIDKTSNPLVIVPL